MKLDPEEIDLLPLSSLPDKTQAIAKRWIEAYEPFNAPSRRETVWKGMASKAPSYILHPISGKFTFPLAWGFDNEIFHRTVYHRNWPKVDQIVGLGGVRLLPSGLDIATVLGSPIAASLLSERGEFRQFPMLAEKHEQLRAVYKEYARAKKRPGNLYMKWIDALATQWARDVMAPANTLEGDLWNTKRLQTGLATWAKLRHATLLINERSAAEAGEGFFEPISMDPPLGYVEPDPATFRAIAGLFEGLSARINAGLGKWVGALPSSPYSNEPEPVVQGVIKRLRSSRDLAARLGDMAEKQLKGRELTDDEYSLIRWIGGKVEHDYLIFQSLSTKELALSIPEPLPRIADVADSGENPPRYLLAAVGNPLVWDQIVPFFGRRQIAAGAVYSYYEFEFDALINDEEWRVKLGGQPRPRWVSRFYLDRPHGCLP